MPTRYQLYLSALYIAAVGVPCANAQNTCIPCSPMVEDSIEVLASPCPPPGDPKEPAYPKDWKCTNLTGNTTGANKGVSSYNSTTCQIPQGEYTGPEHIYRIRLNPGNLVTFKLVPKAPADFVLALMQRQERGDGSCCLTCLQSSIDYTGPHSEIIPALAEPYGKDDYYLYIDSSKGAPSGEYDLTIVGINPTPDLRLEPADTESEKEILAGNNLVYSISVRNEGQLGATDVEVIQCLPPKVVFLEDERVTDERCDLLPKPASSCMGLQTVVCKIGDLKVSPVPTILKVTVAVDQANRGEDGVLQSKVEVKAAEGEPTLLNNQHNFVTPIDARSDLLITSTPSAKEVIAGKDSITYALTVENRGPSLATNVTITDTLPSGIENPKVSEPCTIAGNVVTCKMGKLRKRDKTRAISISAAVKASARGALHNEAVVTATEEEPADDTTPRSRFDDDDETPIRVETVLGITKTSSQDPVVAGKDFSYFITIHNTGHSDSSNVVITDLLPPGIRFQEWDHCTPIQSSNPNQEQCSIDLLRVGDKKTVEMKVIVDAALKHGLAISNKARAKGEDNVDRESPTNDVTVKVEADLQLTMTAARVADLSNDRDICAGENLLYTVTVANHGSSNSQGGRIIYPLLPGVHFVSSPDGCGEKTYQAERQVECTLPALVPDHEPHDFQFVVTPSSTASLEGRACVEGKDFDPDSGNNCGVAKNIEVFPSSDLEVSLVAPTDPVVVSDPTTSPTLNYKLRVQNLGPENAGGVVMRLQLLSGIASVCPSTTTCELEDDIVQCPPVDLSAMQTVEETICIVPSQKVGPVKAVATLHPTERCDSNSENDSAEATVTLAAPNDMDLTLRMTADAETVVVGDLLRYTIRVGNQGPATTPLPSIEIEDELPMGANFEEDVELPSICSDPDQDRKLTCNLSPANNAYPDVVVPVRIVEPIPPAVRAPLVNRARIITAPTDPDLTDNKACIKTPLLPGPLLLPFFEVAGGLEEVTTLFALRNLDSAEVYVQYDFQDALVRLIPHQTDTVNLRRVSEFAGKTGYVAISPEPPKAPRPLLGGDFFRIDPMRGLASGGLLVSAPEMCRSWSVRFLNGGPLDTSTKFLFFAPGNSSEASEPVVTGKVFTEEGRFVQEIHVDTADETFRKTTQDIFNGLPLLARSGSIEWTFRDGLFGHVAAVHREKDTDEVAVPGFCRQPQSTVAAIPASSLILPFFQIDPTNPAGLTTLFALRNETESPVQGEVSYFSGDGTEAGLPVSFSLVGHETKTVNLGYQAPPGVTRGYAKVTLDPEADVSRTLSGDFLLVGPLRSREGGALVRSSQLCRCWDVRFVQDTPSGAETDLLFYVKDQGSGMAMGTVYGEDGTNQGTVPIPLRASFLLRVSDLTLEPPSGSVTGSGAIELDLGSEGYVAALLRKNGPEGAYSVLVPGLCRATCP